MLVARTSAQMARGNNIPSLVLVQNNFLKNYFRKKKISLYSRLFNSESYKLN